MDDSSDAYAVGCLVVLGLIIWGIWSLLTSCYICSDYYLSERCAHNILVDACKDIRDVNDIIEIGPDQRWKDNKGNQIGFTSRRVIYQFTMRPTSGKPVTASSFRSTAIFTFQGDHWVTTCDLDY